MDVGERVRVRPADVAEGACLHAGIKWNAARARQAESRAVGLVVDRISAPRGGTAMRVRWEQPLEALSYLQPRVYQQRRANQVNLIFPPGALEAAAAQREEGAGRPAACSRSRGHAWRSAAVGDHDDRKLSALVDSFRRLAFASIVQEYGMDFDIELRIFSLVSNNFAVTVRNGFAQQGWSWRTEQLLLQARNVDLRLNLPRDDAARCCVS